MKDWGGATDGRGKEEWWVDWQGRHDEAVNDRNDRHTDRQTDRQTEGRARITRTKVKEERWK